MNKLESTLRRLNQAEASVAPQTTAVLKAAIGPLTAADARALVGGPPAAATQLLRKSAEAAFRANPAQFKHALAAKVFSPGKK